MLVTNETDVVLLRQTVRQIAREQRMGLTQQAKLTAAMSAVARGTLAINGDTPFVIHIATDAVQQQPILEVSCMLANIAERGGQEDLAHILHFDDARILVDEADLDIQGDKARIVLRMHMTV